MLNINQLRFNYGTTPFEFSFSLKPGSITALLGPSGAGKSTLLDLIGGFTPPDAGEIYFDGQDLLPLSPDKRPVTTLFQHNNLFLHLNVWQNLALGLHPGMRLNVEQREQLESIANTTGLDELLNQFPSSLSGGQRQRVALARSLLRKKPLLLLDEPFSALDPALRIEMLFLVQRMAHLHQLTVLLITHQPGEIREISDELLFVIDGKIHHQGPPSLLDAPPTQALRDYLGMVTP